jgi:hypothetical protein
MGSFLYYNIESNGTLIPPTHQGYYEQYSDLNGGRFISFGLAPGAGFTLSYFNVFLSFAGFVGGGVMNKKYKFMNRSESELGGYSKINVRVSLGYNGTNIFYGWKFQMDETDSNNGNPDISVKSQIMTIEFFFGMRL